MKQQGEYDMICFESRCIAEKKQLFNSNDNTSSFHYDESHPVECLSKGSPFFRSVSTSAIELKHKPDQMQTAITQIYSNFLCCISQIIVKIHQREAAYVNSVCNLFEKGISFNSFSPHLSTYTQNTNICLEILNHKHENRSDNLQEYINNLPKAILSKINRRNKLVTKNILKLLFDEGTMNIGQELQTDTTYNLRQILSELPQIQSKKYEAAFSQKQQQPTIQLTNNIKLQSFQSIQPNQKKQVKDTNQISIINKRYQRTAAQKQEIYRHIAQRFIKSQVGYRYFPINLRSIIDLNEYRCYQSEVVMKIYKGIKGYISTQFYERDRRYSYSNSDFKNYKKWMTDHQAHIFNSCILKFSGVNPQEPLSPADVYLVYIIIMVHMSKIKKKTLSYIHPYQHLHLLNRKILYLYFHLESMEKVYELLKSAYPTDPEITSINLMNRFKQVLLGALDNIRKTNDKPFYGEFRELLKQEKDIGGFYWKQIIIDLSEYALTGDNENIASLNNRILNLVKQKQGSLNLEFSDLSSRIYQQSQKSSYLIYQPQSQAYLAQQRAKRRERVCDKVKLQHMDVINDNSMHDQDLIDLDQSENHD